MGKTYRYNEDGKNSKKNKKRPGRREQPRVFKSDKRYPPEED